MIDVCDWMEVDQGQRGRGGKGEMRRRLEIHTERMKKFPSSLFINQEIVILPEGFQKALSI